MSTKLYTAKLTVIDCADCAMDFGVTPRFYNERRRDHRTFYCPAGHRNFYPGESDLEKARRERDAAKARATHLSDQLDSARRDTEHERRSKAAVKGHLTRIRNRIAAGVCPCCNRTFQDVARHMASQHPEFAADLEAKEREVAQ